MFDAKALRERQERWRRFHEWEAEEEVKRTASRTVEEKLNLSGVFTVQPGSVVRTCSNENLHRMKNSWRSHIFSI